MKEDPIVAEVRRIREEHAASLGYDLDAIAADAKTREGKDGAPVVSLSSRRVPSQIKARE